MLVVMLIFVTMSAGLFYASRVEAIQSELSLFLGFSPMGDSKPSRHSHLIFLLFTYASPLLLAGSLATIHGILNRKR